MWPSVFVRRVGKANGRATGSRECAPDDRLLRARCRAHHGLQWWGREEGGLAHPTVFSVWLASRELAVTPLAACKMNQR
jgi:hypothetical protein